MKLTIPLIRVPEIDKGQCFECALDEDSGETQTCRYIKSTQGSCADNHCIYIVDTPDSIVNYTKVRITE